MEKLEKGFVQIYTGNGKGKTTAAIGLAVRAAGKGLKTFMIQFMKEYPYSELTSLKKLSDFIEIEQCCKDDFVLQKELPSIEEIEKAKNGLLNAKFKMKSGNYDLIILDEALVSIYFKLFSVEEIVDFIKCKPDKVELILTGRYCPEEIINCADLVTEMKEVKHYYQKNILSRKGIDS
jgi:cob(I)alamin adenosyltransferase